MDQKNDSFWPVGKRAAFFSALVIFCYGLFDYTDRTIIAILFPYLKEAWGLTDTQLGMLPMGLTFSAGILAIPFAYAIDRWSRKKMLVIMGAIWAAAVGACKIAGGFGSLMLARVSAGVGEATYTPAGQPMVAAQFPEKYRGTAISITCLGIAFGGPVGFVFGSFIAGGWGWHTALGLMAFPGAVIVIASLFLKESKHEAKDAAEAEPRSNLSYFAVVRELCHNPSVILLYLGVISFAMVMGVGVNWMPTYFERVAKLPPDVCGYISGGIMVGSPLGVFLLGPIHDFLKKRYKNAPALVLLCLASVCFIITFTAYYICVPGTVLQIVLLISSSLCLGSFMAASSVAVLGCVKPEFSSSAIGIQVFCMNLLGVPFGSLFTGMISDVYGIGTAFVIMHSICLISAFFYFICTRTYAKDAAKAMEQ